jgi:hypothetical protein
LNNITTSPYVKPTSINSCLLNFDSECPFRYKQAVIKNLIKRAKLISSSKIIFQNALKQIKQKLVNNGFPNHIIDEEIKYTLRKIDMNENKPPDTKNKQIDLYYCSQMHSNFEKDETAIKQIVRRYINTTDKQTHLKLTIYYKKHKTANLLIMNNSSPPKSFLQKSNVVYQFNCTLGECFSNNSIYIGHTTNRLSRRLTLHLNDSSSISKHLKDQHNCPHSNIRKILDENTKILTYCNNIKKLKILEAILIKTKQPVINKVKFEYCTNILTCV